MTRTPNHELKISALRYSDSGSSTQSLTFVDGAFFCHGLEDGAREVKVAGATCIPQGLYEVKFREVDSPLTLTYREKFDWFTYHLEIQDVPNFSYVYIHIGNTEKNTDGCYLVGHTINTNQVASGFLGNSADAYERLYKRVSDHLTEGGRVYIELYTGGPGGYV